MPELTSLTTTVSAAAPPLDFPEKLQCLFHAKRYKVLYGGRGGAKSWGVARALLILGSQKPLRILCAREYQNSVKESVHQVISQQVEALGLNHFYDVLETEIRGANGTVFNFEGIRRNVNRLRSYEGTDVCWVEEAANVTKNSWDVLVPTIRKPDSEIWMTFNPELKTDETYQRFVLHRRPDSFVVKMNWRDNPWFPQVLQEEMEDLKGRDFDAYLNVWEGFPKQNLEGAVYAKQMRDAEAEGRITRVGYDQTAAVQTFWDLGRADLTAIWFAQAVAFEYRVIDYYEARGHHLDHFLKVLQNRPYIYGTTWLPHDAWAKTLGSKRSIQEQVRDKFQRVRQVPKLSISDGINAARTIFPLCYFDEEKCESGLEALRSYRFDIDKVTQQWSKQPVHDDSSNGADAFRYLAVALKPPEDAAKKRRGRSLMSVLNGAWSGGGDSAWMQH